MPVGELSLAITVDLEQALAEITKIAQDWSYGMTPEQQDVAANIVTDAITSGTEDRSASYKYT